MKSGRSVVKNAKPLGGSNQSFEVLAITNNSFTSQSNCIMNALFESQANSLSQTAIFNPEFRPNIPALPNPFRLQTLPQDVLTLQLQDGTIYLPLKDILYFQGERNYSYIFTRNGRRILIAKTLKEFEKLLNPQTFFRCHKSYLINGFHIQQQEENTIELSGEAQVMISRRKKSAFKDWFARFQIRFV
ncbi:MAG: LytTR family DNA-binding domain-containing protein [Bacteroidota bacterium]